jgi:hypothetical protein
VNNLDIPGGDLSPDERAVIAAMRRGPVLHDPLLIIQRREAWSRADLLPGWQLCANRPVTWDRTNDQKLYCLLDPGITPEELGRLRWALELEEVRQCEQAEELTLPQAGQLTTGEKPA